MKNRSHWASATGWDSTDTSWSKFAAGTADQVVDDGNDHFPDDVQAAFYQQIEGTMDGAGETIFHRREDVIRFEPSRIALKAASKEPRGVKTISGPGAVSARLLR